MMARTRRDGAARTCGGFAIAELTVALAILTLVAVWGIQTEVARVRDAAAAASGVWLLEIRHGVLQLLGSHFDTLSRGESPRAADGSLAFQDAWRPTLAELQRAGHLPESYPGRSTLGFGADIVIAASPACPGEPCRLDALVTSDRALEVDGREDWSTAAAAVMAMQGWGATVSRQRPGRFVGATVALPNPLRADSPARPIGTVAAWAGLDRASTRDYLRVGDERDPGFKGNLTVAGRVQGQAVHSRQDIQADGRIAGEEVVASGALRLHGVVRPGGSCAAPGAFTRDPAGQLVACVNGVWQTPTDGFGGAFGLNTTHGCTVVGNQSMRNPRTGKCTCPSGYTAVPIAESGSLSLKEGYTIGYVCIRPQ